MSAPVTQPEKDSFQAQAHNANYKDSKTDRHSASCRAPDAVVGWIGRERATQTGARAVRPMPHAR